jgi:hypothetical protein
LTEKIYGDRYKKEREGERCTKWQLNAIRMATCFSKESQMQKKEI